MNQRAHQNEPAAPFDLSAFCDQSGRSPLLASPWNQRGFTYATDDFLALRLSPRADVPTADNPLTASLEKLFADHAAYQTARFEPLPASAAKKKPTVSCRLCHGSGAVLNAKQKAEICERCHGEKLVWNVRGVTIGNRRVATHYLVKLSAVPGIRVAANVGHASHPLWFTYDGGEGLLMPLRSDS